MNHTLPEHNGTEEPLVAEPWFRRFVVVVVAVGVAVAALVAAGVPIDMSFGPTFSTEAQHVDPTEAHFARFGAGGSTDVVLLVDVGDLAERQAALSLADLSTELGALDEVAAVTDPTDLALYDDVGELVPRSLRTAEGDIVAQPEYQRRVELLHQSAPLRDLVISDDRATVLVAATLANTADFSERRHGVEDITAVVDAWSERTGYDVAVTGFPEIEAVYAREIMMSVLIVIAVLYAIVSVLLFLYVRSIRLTAIVISGVSLAMPMTLAAMRLMGQPFSIVNSQVLTLVAIVGVAHGLHQVDAYRKSRLSGASHRAAAQSAAETLAPSIATGLTTVAGFLALATATMPAVRSFGFSTAVGVGIVYALNATLIPVFLESMAKRPINPKAPLAAGIARLLHFFANLARSRPGTVVAVFAVSLIAFSAFGLPRLEVDQRVSEELPASHPTHQAQVLHETELSGYLGPNLWVRSTATDIVTEPEAIAAFVNGLCGLDGVLHVASPLDLVPQVSVLQAGDACTRSPFDLEVVRAFGETQPGGTVNATNGLVAEAALDGITIRVRTADFGTARALELLDEINALVDATLPPGTEVDPVGDWVLAQHGMNRLANDVGLSAGFALLVVLPMIGLALRNLRMFLASLLPTVLPVIATLAFLGAMGITLRIGTAMILAICLGLAADDTIYIFADVRRRIDAGDHPSSAMVHALTTSGPPALFSSLVLVAGLLSMTLNQLLVLRDMGIVAAFTMTFAVLCDLLLGPAMYHLLHRRTVVEMRFEDEATADTHQYVHRPAFEREPVFIDTVRLPVPVRPAAAGRVGATARLEARDWQKTQPGRNQTPPTQTHPIRPKPHFRYPIADLPPAAVSIIDRPTHRQDSS